MRRIKPVKRLGMASQEDQQEYFEEDDRAVRKHKEAKLVSAGKGEFGGQQQRQLAGQKRDGGGHTQGPPAKRRAVLTSDGQQIGSPVLSGFQPAVAPASSPPYPPSSPPYPPFLKHAQHIFITLLKQKSQFLLNEYQAPTRGIQNIFQKYPDIEVLIKGHFRELADIDTPHSLNKFEAGVTRAVLGYGFNYESVFFTFSEHDKGKIRELLLNFKCYQIYLKLERIVRYPDIASLITLYENPRWGLGMFGQSPQVSSVPGMGAAMIASRDPGIGAAMIASRDPGIARAARTETASQVSDAALWNVAIEEVCGSSTVATTLGK
jgi:hypothetical protein